LLFFLSVFFNAYPAASAPTPSVTANGGNRVMMMTDMLLDVKIEFDPGSDAGKNADWWCIAEIVPGTFYSYQLDGSWRSGKYVSYQGPLMNLSPYQVLNLGGLPAGNYKVSFGVDLNMNGVQDNPSYYDSVDISIPVYDCPSVTEDSQIVLSSTQKSFIASRGNPDLFAIAFVSQEADSTGHPYYSNKIRRIENWAYNTDKLTTVVFDNGFFMSETPHTIVADLQATPLSPSQFTHCMSREDILALIGEPSCTQTEIMGGSTYSYMRYNPTHATPAVTVVLENGVLITVMAGYSFVYPASNGADLCVGE